MGEWYKNCRGCSRRFLRESKRSTLCNKCVRRAEVKRIKAMKEKYSRGGVKRSYRPFYLSESEEEDFVLAS